MILCMGSHLENWLLIIFVTNVLYYIIYNTYISLVYIFFIYYMYIINNIIIQPVIYFKCLLTIILFLTYILYINIYILYLLYTHITPQSILKIFRVLLYVNWFKNVYLSIWIGYY